MELRRLSHRKEGNQNEIASNLFDYRTSDNRNNFDIVKLNLTASRKARSSALIS